MLPLRVSTRARPSPFHRCPTRPSGKGSTRRAVRCRASFRVLSRPADTTSSVLKRQRPDAGFAKEKSPAQRTVIAFSSEIERVRSVSEAVLSGAALVSLGFRPYCPNVVVSGDRYAEARLAPSGSFQDLLAWPVIRPRPSRAIFHEGPLLAQSGRSESKASKISMRCGLTVRATTLVTTSITVPAQFVLARWLPLQIRRRTRRAA